MARCTPSQRYEGNHLLAIPTVVYDHDHVVPKSGGLPPNVGNGNIRGEASDNTRNKETKMNKNEL